MVLLILRDDTFQDRIALFFTRLIDRYRLETPLECRILFDMLPVLVEGRRTDDLELPTGQGRLQDIGRIEGTLGTTGTDDGMQLIDKEQNLSVLYGFSDDALDTLLELTAVLRACNHAGDIERHNTLLEDGVRNIAGDDTLGQSLYHCGLADTRLTDEAWIVLRTSGQDLHDTHDFTLPADDRIELSFRCHRGEIPRILIQCRCIRCRLLCRLRTCRIVDDDIVSDDRHDLLVHTLCVPTERSDDTRGDAVRILQHRDQDVLRPDESGTRAQGFLHRVLHQALRRWRISCTLVDRHLRIGGDELRDHIKDLLIIDTV